MISNKKHIKTSFIKKNQSYIKKLSSKQIFKDLFVGPLLKNLTNHLTPLKFNQLLTLGILISIVSMVIFSYLNPYEIDGWRLTGNAAEKYEIGVIVDEERNEKVGYIKSIEEDIYGEFGTIAQSIGVKKYLGKRLEFTAYLKTKEVDGWSGMWMRVDGKDREVLAFDNMQNRSLIGTNGWAQYKVVLDVPRESTSISYGVLVSGTGMVWIDDVEFKEVDDSVASTQLNDMGV